MKVLQVIHDFLPRHQAGSELYCYHLSKALQNHGHEVRLFYTEIDHTQAQYRARKGAYDGLPYWEVINNHAYHTFEETYNNPKLEAIFARVLDDFQPDAVHFHHLMSLSYGCVSLCKERGIPVVFTLHDYWLTCPRGGQRYRGGGDVCEVEEFQACSECISRYSFPSGLPSRLLKKGLGLFERVSPPNLISAMKYGRIEARESSYVSTGALCVDGQCKETLFMHPPCRLQAKVAVPRDAEMVFAVAMAPQTYDKEGDAVRFTIRRGEKLLYERVVDAKQNPAHRQWFAERLSLAKYPGKQTLTFQTEAYPNGNNVFCSAGWGEPKLLSSQGEGFQPSLTDRVRRWGESLLFRFQKSRLGKMVGLRMQRTRELFDNVDLFIAPSQFLRDVFIAFGMNSQKIVFSDYGIARKRFTPNTRPVQKPIQFTFIGTFVEHKGVHVLIEAFNQLPKGVAQLNLYGDLTEFTGYVKQVQAMIAHPDIYLRGRAENKDIPNILANTDAQIVPSIWYENSPITIHEAFLAAVPVITSNFGGMADLVHHEINGLLFERGHVEELRNCLLRCVETPSLLETLRPNPDAVKTVEDDARWMEDVYKTLKANQPIPKPPDAV